jgi:hypothetical protein
MRKLGEEAKRSQRLHVRLSQIKKGELRKQATDLGLTMTEIVEHKIGNIPIVDNRIKREQFAAIYALCKEINYIGKNINQLTIAIRQIRSDKKIEEFEFSMLVQELAKYNEKRNEISELLGKNLF